MSKATFQGAVGRTTNHARSAAARLLLEFASSNWIYASALYRDDGATHDDHQEAVTTIEDTARIARRVFGGAHPLTSKIEVDLQEARAALRAREVTPPSSA